MTATNPRPLTPKQRQVLDYMRSFHERNDQLPPMAAIARHFGWKSGNAAQVFADILTAKGFIEKNEVGRYRFTRQPSQELPPVSVAGDLVRLPVRDMLPPTHSWGRERCS